MDQMSIIPLDNIVSKHEAFSNSSVHEFAISKMSGRSNIGLTDDSIIGAFLTSRENTKINKKNAARILGNCIEVDFIDDFEKLFNEKEYVKGNDIFSLILPKINYKNTSQWYDSKFEDRYSDYEKTVLIKNGKIISGVLDGYSIKVGAGNSIYRVIQHEYDNATSCTTAFNMQQIILNYTMYEGFTISIEDLVVSGEALTEIRTKKMVERLDDLNNLINDLKVGNLVVPVGYNLKDHFEDIFTKKSEMSMIDVANYVDFEKNKLFQLIQSGSKGKKSVMFQILGTIGVQKLKGKLIDTKFAYQRTLPFYQRFDISPEARGFIKNSFLTGMSSPEFLLNAMDSRNNIINVALMTAVTGDQNRKSTKNLESIIVNNLRIIKNPRNILQLLYGNDGFEVEKCMPISLDKYFNISNEEFKTKFYNDELKDEYNLLLKYKKQFEVSSHQYQYYQCLNNKFSDTFKITSPIDIEHIIINILTYHSNKIKNIKANNDKKYIKDLINKIDNFCNNLQYIYFNENLQKKHVKVPECYVYGMYNIKLQIKLFLCSNLLIKNNINMEILDLILADIKLKLIKALIEPGTPIGLLTAQFISEPLTQSSLDTKHGAAQVEKKGGIGRIKEILSVKASSKITDLQMLIMLKPEYISNYEMNTKISTYLEMLKLEVFVSRFQILFEEPLIPSFSKYKHESAIIKRFLEINKGVVIPKNLSKFCVRIEINKEMLFSKNMELKEIIYKLRKSLSNDLIIYNNENQDEVFIRIYISEYSIDKKIKNNLNMILENLKKILQINIRGIEGITYAKIKTLNNIKNYNNGELINTKEQYVIITKGVNMYELLLIEEIDETKIQIDDINLYLELWGIEATKTKISYELKDLIDDKLNPKHYELTVDNMTLKGNLASFEKPGLNKREKENILLRLSMSHTREVLTESVINNMEASTVGLSSSLMVGQAPEIGASMNQFYIDTTYLSKLYKIDESKIDQY